MRKKFVRIALILLVAALVIPSSLLTKVTKAATTETITLYHETFASGQGKATRAGSANLSQVTGKTFTGNDDGKALYVSNRVNNWDGADFKFSDIGLENGQTYTVTATVYVDADVTVPSGAQAGFQTVNGYQNTIYVNYEAGKALTLTKEFTVDTSKDSALRINSNTAGAGVPFYLGDILVTKNVAAGPVVETPRLPAVDFPTITFEDQTNGGFAGRKGTETLTVISDANHTEGGTSALKVEGRTETWHGPSLRVEKYVDKGFEYKITAWVKLISPGSSQLQLSTQVGNASASYNTVDKKTISTEDGWVKFEGNYRYNTVPDEFLSIYVESSSSKDASFYIDDISFVESSAPISVQTNLTPIKDAYRNDFLIGNAVSAADLDGVRLQLLKLHNNVVTAENAMKPDQTYNANKEFDFATEDALVTKIQAAGLKLHGHVLVWHQQTPTWLTTTTDSLPLGRVEALANLKTHIQTVMEHYGNKVISWDVVNEAMNDNPSNPSNWHGALRQSPWKAAIGDDYVEQAFLAAKEVLDAHPTWDIKLYYNDYNEDNQNKAQAIYSMVKEINDRYALTHPGKLLIDGVGMQAHYNLNTKPDNVKLSLEKFISLGVQVSISELDITAGSNSRLTEKEANAQGSLYAQIFQIFKAHAAHIERVTFWGLNDATSWRASQNPQLFNSDLQAKPAYFGVIDPAAFLAAHPPESVAQANQSTAKFATPTIDGMADDAAWSQAPDMAINRYQQAWQGASGVAKALWDDQNLYVLIQVSNAELDKSSANAYEQDSVEIFLDENNAKTSSYEADDGQYRINFGNEQSFNPASKSAGVESKTHVSGTNYTVEVKIPLKTITPEDNTKLGFDVQINDAKNGARQSVAAWNDTTGTGFQDTSVYGVLNLTGKVSNPSDGGDPDPGSGTGSGSGTVPSTSTDTGSSGGTITPELKTENGRTIAAISGDTLKKALEQAAPTANVQKQIVIEVPKQANATSYEVQLPTQSLRGQDNFELSVKTADATIQIPSNMLSGVTENAEQVSLRVAKVSKDNMDTATREQIGNRPVIELTLAAGDKVIAWNNPNAPVTVAIPYLPTEEELSDTDHIIIWYIDGQGKATPVPNGRYNAASGTVVFQTTHFSTYAVASVFKTFGDLQYVPWAKQAIDTMASRDVIHGTDENSFSPEASIKRADFIALLVRSLELHTTSNDVAMFSDVPKTAYYYNELVIAKALGITTGFEDNTFKPDSPISRQDMMVLTTRAMAAADKQVQVGGTLDAYPDAASMSSYAKDSAAALVKSGIVNGKNDKLAPIDELTRAEGAVILYRIWQK
ncbi:endo-1,4-beta-xylanase [Paenibacillus sp. Soil750]|uniref:endo-1,4-beta-xylanase n=1 Tax=Paenibacillus sp. Soil750 TaxID=1736398 RepID=UPI00070167D2|nr:endo-1,4-beta-xylanase [Paenibacillus sp. Soil750]KRE70929.1 1,4-beta-xylanase [Paenibacillus sp. Soil750]